MSQTKNVKIRINALFHRLQINKAIKFQTRMTWKRHQNKVETRLVNHEHGYSIFEQSISIDFNLAYNQSKGAYQDKNTEIVAIIMYEGKVKSGGYAKYNISQVINNNLEGKVLTIPLSQCPDPNANVQVTFTIDYLQQALQQAPNDTPSVLNASSRDFNMSRVDFHDDKISLQMERINSTINKLGDLAKTIKEKEKSSNKKLPEMVKNLQDLEGQKSTLLLTITKLQEKINSKEKTYAQQRKKDQITIINLEKQLQKKAKEFKSREFIEIDQQKKLKQDISKKAKQIQKYRKLYQETLSELQQLKSKQLRGSIGFNKMQVDDVHQIARFSNQRQDMEISKQIEQLRAQNNDLQIKVATSSFRVAQLFNAAYEIGGGKLLDQLQKSIGLIEM